MGQQTEGGKHQQTGLNNHETWQCPAGVEHVVEDAS